MEHIELSGDNFTGIDNNGIYGVSVSIRDSKNKIVIPEAEFMKILEDGIQKYIKSVKKNDVTIVDLRCGEFIGVEKPDQFRKRALYTAVNLTGKGNTIKYISLGHDTATIKYVKPGETKDA